MSDPIEMRLVLGGPIGEVWVDGVNLAKQVGLVTVHAPPGGPTVITMEVVPDSVILDVQGEVEFKCVACGQPVNRPETSARDAACSRTNDEQ